MHASRNTLLIGLCAALLTGCGGGSGGSGSSRTGDLTLRVTDAPVDSATAVVVEFTGVELRGASNQTFHFDSPRQIDLLALTGGENEILLEGVRLPAGRYNQLRLLINAGEHASDSYIAFEDGTTHPLHIPSGAQTGLKLVNGFTVPAGGSADFTVDFDLRKSVTKPKGQNGVYFLRPTLRLVDSIEAGAVAGTVAMELATAAGCEPAVYVYTGADAAVDDVGSGSEPLSSAQVELEPGSGEYSYRVAYLEPGDYTAAFTCAAGHDDPEQDDEIVFFGASNATVARGQTARVDFAITE